MMFQDIPVCNVAEVNDKNPIDEDSGEKEATIVVKNSSGEKREKAILTRNATRRRKSDSDTLVKFKKLKRSSLTDPFGFDDNKIKSTSPVAKRTRCRRKKRSDKNTGQVDRNLRIAARTNPKLSNVVFVKEEMMMMNDNHVEGTTSKTRTITKQRIKLKRHAVLMRVIQR